MGADQRIDAEFTTRAEEAERKATWPRRSIEFALRGFATIGPIAALLIYATKRPENQRFASGRTAVEQIAGALRAAV